MPEATVAWVDPLPRSDRIALTKLPNGSHSLALDLLSLAAQPAHEVHRLLARGPVNEVRHIAVGVDAAPLASDVAVDHWSLG